MWCPWEEDMIKEGHEVQVIGRTHYNTNQLVEIGIHWVHPYSLIERGRALVDGFGDYHRLFWNSQKYFWRRFVTTPATAEFQHFTSSEVPRLVKSFWIANFTAKVLCCFLVTAPLSETTTKREDERITALIEHKYRAAWTWDRFSSWNRFSTTHGFHGPCQSSSHAGQWR